MSFHDSLLVACANKHTWLSCEFRGEPYNVSASADCLLARSYDIMSTRTKIVSILALTFCTAIAGYPGLCVNMESANELDDQLESLTSKILHKEIAFDQANLRFQLNTQSNRLKAWRYFASQEAAAGLIEAGLLTGIVDRRHQMVHMGKIKGILIEDSLVPQMVGQTIGAAGDAAELSFNARRSFIAHRNGTDLTSIKKNATRMHQELLTLLKQREDLVNATKPDGVPKETISDLECSILKNQEKILWWQFSKSLIDTKKIAATQNSFYALDFFKNVTGATGNLVGLDSTHQMKPRVNIGANILTTVSGVFVIADPVVASISGHVIAKPFRKGLETSTRESLQGTIDAVTRDTLKLRKLGQDVQEQGAASYQKSLTRTSIYDKQLLSATKLVRADRNQDRISNRAALGQRGVAVVVGGTKISVGVAGIIAADRLSAQAGPPLLLGGTIAYAAGTAITLEENLRIILKRELRYRKDRRNHLRAEDILSRQLTELSELDQTLYRQEADKNASH